MPPSDVRNRSPTFPPSAPPSIDSGAINIRVNQDASGADQNETVIAANPLDPLNLVAGSNDYRTGILSCGFYASHDGGQTWIDGVIPENTYLMQADPAVAFCGDGSAYFAMISHDGVFLPAGIPVYRSTDGGLTWPERSMPVDHPLGIPFPDKEWLACDTTSSMFSNRLYLVWTEIGITTKDIHLKWTSDAGQTWSDAVQVSDGLPPVEDTQAAVVAIGPDGEVHVAWWHDVGDTQRLGFDSSRDGGQTFGPDVFPADVTGIPEDPHFRRFSFPTMDADRSGGPHRGNVYIAWADARNGDPDILLTRSTDGGSTWSPPVRVNDDPAGRGADQWFPWLAVDPNGRVIVTFHDRRRFAGRSPYEIWGAISRDGGRTFDTNFLVSEVASDASLTDWIGDYAGLAATADRLYPLWTDLRAGTGETDIYTDRFPNTFAYDEVRGVAFLDPTTMDFETQDDRFGVDLQYDVVTGSLVDLRADASYDRASCLESRLEDPPLVDARTPAAGDGFYYLVRARGIDGAGTYGDGTAARPNVRDPLDETLVLCP